MKVAYILHDTDTLGGANKSFLPMLYGLIGKGVEPLVVLPDDRGIYRELTEHGIKTLLLNYRPNTYPYNDCLKDYLLWLPRLVARRYVNAKAASQLARYIKGYDIVHTNVSIIDIGARAAKLSGIPHVYHFREYADLDFGMIYFPCKVYFYKTVTNSVCITKGVKEHHKLGENSRVVYDCILSSEQYDSSVNLTSTTKTYILFAGRLEQTKGIEELLIAYASSKRKLPLWIAGAPLKNSYFDMLKQMVKTYGMQDKVVFLGARHDILELMAGACATIVPSHNEGFGRILSEAMFAKCLTIGRNTGGTKEQFDNGLALNGNEIGLRFNTVEELTALIDKVCMADKTVWSGYIDRAYHTVTTLYTQEACANSIMELYNTIKKRK